MIISKKFYVPVVTLSINDNTKCSENIKQGFKRTISWNKYRSEIATQPKNNNLDYLINATFRNIFLEIDFLIFFYFFRNRFFVLSLKNGNDNPTGDSFDKYYMSLVEIKDFNA